VKEIVKEVQQVVAVQQVNDIQQVKEVQIEVEVQQAAQLAVSNTFLQPANETRLV
jgi:hypothetical protein